MHPLGLAGAGGEQGAVRVGPEQPAWQVGKAIRTLLVQGGLVMGERPREALGGIVGPWLFGVLIGSGERAAISWGYAFGATLMLAAAAVTPWLGLAAERRSLEDVARPLSSVD